MTLQTILEQLYDLDRKAQTLIIETGFNSNDGFGSQVFLNFSDFKEQYLREFLILSLDQFEQLHKDLFVLNPPVHSEYALKRFPEGRYGYDDEDGFLHVFTCGMPIEAKLADSEGESYWIQTRIEHNGKNYFLWPHHSIPLDGLIVRERW